jgi:DNA-binding MarR family transcriptional regulator
MLRDLELTSARWQVLGAIVQTPRTVAQIARYFELTRQGVLWVVQSMLKDGIVELAKNPATSGRIWYGSLRKGRKSLMRSTAASAIGLMKSASFFASKRFRRR